MRALVIDDGAGFALAVQRSLPGHDVTVEADASAAIARIEKADSDGDPFAVVLCDFTVLRTWGHDVVGRLRSTREPPMLILASDASHVVEAAFIADHVLIAPVRPREILEALDAIKTQRARTTTRRLRRTPSATPRHGFDVRR